MATYSSILVWRFPWTEEPGRLLSTGSQRVRHDCDFHFHLCITLPLTEFFLGSKIKNWHLNMYNIMYETSRQSRFDARYWMLGAGALGQPRGKEWGGRREEGSGWGTQVYLWQIHFDIWQN